MASDSFTLKELFIQASTEQIDGEAWRRFVSRLHRPISLAIKRTIEQWGRDPSQVVDDLVQETYLKLWASRQQLFFMLRESDTIIGYIKSIAINVTHDHLRALHCQKRGSGEQEKPFEEQESISSNHIPGGLNAIENEILFREIDKLLESLPGGVDPERDRIIFWFYFKDGFSCKEIAALPTIGLTAKGVESTIARLKFLLRRKIHETRWGVDDLKNEA